MSVTLKSYANIGWITSIAQVLVGSPQEAFHQPVRAAVVPRHKWPRAKGGPVRVGGFLPCGSGEAEAHGTGAINVIGISCTLCDHADRIGPTSEFWSWNQASSG
jgi:hypothetical protein